MDWEDKDTRKWWHYDDCSVSETMNPAHQIIEKKNQNDKMKKNVNTTSGKKKSTDKDVDNDSNDDLMEIDDEEYSDEKVKKPKPKPKPKQKVKQKANVKTECEDEESVIISDEKVSLVDCHEVVVQEVYDLSTDGEVDIEVEVGGTSCTVNSSVDSTSSLRSSMRLTINSNSNSSSSSSNSNASAKAGNNVNYRSKTSSTCDLDSKPNSESTSMLKRKRLTRKIPSPKEPVVPSPCTSPMAEEGKIIDVNSEVDVIESDKGDTAQTLPKFPALDRSKDAYILCYVKKKSVNSCFRRQRQLPSSFVLKSVEETSKVFLTEVERYAVKRDLIINQISDRKRIFQEVSQFWLPCREHVQGDEPYHLLPTSWLNQWCSGEVNKKAEKTGSGTRSKKVTDVKDNTVDLTSPPNKDVSKGLQMEVEGKGKMKGVEDEYVSGSNSGGDTFKLPNQCNNGHVDMTVISDIDNQYQNTVKDSHKEDEFIDQETDTSDGKIAVHSQRDALMSEGGGIVSDSLSMDPDCSPEVGNEYDCCVFDDPADNYILPLLCPHYLINGVCSVHPDNISAFKVVTHQAYTAIMATVNSRKQTHITPGHLNSTASDGKSSVNYIHSHHDSITGTCSNIENCDTGISVVSSEREREVNLIDSHLPQYHARGVRIDVTSETYRCEICYSEVLAKRNSLQVIY